MASLVAFLRGINVGGRVVRKETLSEAFEELGLGDVGTYRQSGNVIFEARKVGPEEKEIEAALRRKLGYDAPTFVRTLEDLRRVVALSRRVPRREDDDLLVTLLPHPIARFPLRLPATIPKSTAQVVLARGSEVFSITHGGGEGGLPNPFVEASLRVKTTTRNINVINGIVERYGGRAARGTPERAR